MSHTLTCPNPSCGKSYQVSAEYLGRRGKCKSCGTEFVFGAKSSGSDAGDSSPAVKAGAPQDSFRERAQVPSRLGRFQILERVGMGGFGAVYRAQDPQLQRPVALKLLQTTGDKQRDQHRINRFLVEGRAGARLQHPNIVPVFDAGKDEETGEYYMAAAFIRGQPLSAAIDGQPLELKRAATIALQLAQALDYAHRQGILHRDVKPDNVMLDEKGVPHLMDFGLARMEESESHLTRDGAVMGTPSYMSPEQCVGNQEALGPAADQYSLGCLLYELLTGEKLFDGPVSVQIHHQINTEVPPPSRKHAQIPPDLDTICLKTLAKEPERRYASCAALAADLERWLADEPIQARQLTAWERWNRWRRRNPAIAWLSIGLATALLFGLIGITTQWLRAEGHARAAIQAAEEEKRAKETAESAQLAAEQSADNARQEKERADEQTAAVLKTAEALEREVYKQRIAGAYHEWEDDNVLPAEELLADCDEPLRGWEWHYCNRLCHQAQLTFREHNREVSVAAFSPDGQTVASFADAGKIHVWDANTGTIRYSIDYPLKPRLARGQFAAFSPDGRYLASASEAGAVRFWSVSDGKEAFVLDGLGQSVASIAFSPISRTIAIGLGPGEDFSSTLPVVTKIWDYENKADLLTLDGHGGAVAGLAYSPSGKRLATSGTDGRIKVWDAETGALLNTMVGGDLNPYFNVVFSVVFSSDEQRLFSAGADDVIRTWDLTNAKTLSVMQGHKNDILCLALSPNGALLASSSWDKSVKIWSAVDGRLLNTLRGHVGLVRSIGFAADNRRIVSASHDGTVRIWDATLDQRYRELPFDDRSYALQYSPDGRTLVLGADVLRMFDSETGEPRPSKINLNRPRSLSFSSDGTKLAASGQGSLKIWRLQDETETLVIPLPDQPNSVQGLCFSPDDRSFAYSRSNAVIVADAESGSTLLKYEQHRDMVQWVSFFPDGKFVLSQSADGVIRAWDSLTGQDFFEHSAPFSSGSWQENLAVCRNFAFGSADQVAIGGGVARQRGEIQFLSLLDGSVSKTVHGHTGMVSTLAFNQDRTRLVSGATDGSIKVRDGMTGDEIMTLHAGSRILTLAVSPDGNRIAAGRGEWTVRVWNGTPLKDSLP